MTHPALIELTCYNVCTGVSLGTPLAFEGATAGIAKVQKQTHFIEENQGFFEFEVVKKEAVASQHPHRRVTMLAPRHRKASRRTTSPAEKCGRGIHEERRKIAKANPPFAPDSHRKNGKTNPLPE